MRMSEDIAKNEDEALEFIRMYLFAEQGVLYTKEDILRMITSIGN